MEDNSNNITHLQAITRELRKLLEAEKQQQVNYKATAIWTNCLHRQMEQEMQPHSASGAVVTKAGHLLLYTIL